MAFKHLGIVILATVSTAGLGAAGVAAADMTKKASATLVDAEGKSIGKVAFVQARDGLKVKATVAGVKAGTYGFHIHTAGKCDAPDFASAGGHWNPTEHKHGKENPEGPHMGDLPNVDVAPSGMGTLEFVVPGAMLSGGEHPLLDTDGASAMLHAGPDDYKTDPSGASGARIACGVIEPSK